MSPSSQTQRAILIVGDRVGDQDPQREETEIEIINHKKEIPVETEVEIDSVKERRVRIVAIDILFEENEVEVEIAILAGFQEAEAAIAQESNVEEVHHPLLLHHLLLPLEVPLLTRRVGIHGKEVPLRAHQLLPDRIPEARGGEKCC